MNRILHAYLPPQGMVKEGKTPDTNLQSHSLPTANAKALKNRYCFDEGTRRKKNDIDSGGDCSEIF